MFRNRSKSLSKKPNEKVIFKKFLDFLQSSMWQLPISMFIEQNSIVFDRDQLEPTLFKSIHNQFSQIVDSLINAHCEDAKITPKDLVDALKSIDKAKKLTFKERILLEPVVAAQDFNVFVPMMMRKNVELQLQALKLMQHMTGIIPTAMTLADEDAAIWNMLQEEDECERFILISVIRKSREDYSNGSTYWGELNDDVKQQTVEEEKILKSIQEQHQQGLDDAIIKNLENGLQALILKDYSESNETETTSEQLKTSSKDEKLESKLQKGSLSMSSATRPSTSKKAPPPLTITPATIITATTEKSPTKKTIDRRKSMDSGKTITVPGYANNQKRMSYVGGIQSPKEGSSGSKVSSPNSAISPTSSKFDYRSLLKEKEQISEEQIKARADYLKKQRDKLLELKKIEQQKQLQEQTEKAALERPKTAKAARAAMESKLETRKAIASKLKVEVVDASESKK